MTLNATELAERIDAVDYDIGRVWHTTDAAPLVLTYRFEESSPSDFPWSDVSGFSGWNDAQERTVRAALAEYETVINVRFVEDTSAADADLSFYRASNGLSGGRGRFHYSGQDWDGHAVFNTNRALDESDIDLVIHEIGHALGLKHTGHYDVGGNFPPGPFLPDAEDNRLFSIMSYNPIPDGGWPNHLAVYDIAALQARFGANNTHAGGRNTYEAPDDGILETIWDSGGRDTISSRLGDFEVYDDLAAYLRPKIDLRQGHVTDFGEYYFDYGKLVVAYGVDIENGLGGAAKDTIIGNHLRNRLAGGANNDRLFGGSGADSVLGGDGNDKLHGGSGRDRLNGGRGRDELSGDSGADIFVFRGRFGSDTITDFDTTSSREVIDCRGINSIRSYRDLVSNHLSENFDGDAVIDAAHAGQVTLLNVSLDELDRFDFIF